MVAVAGVQDQARRTSTTFGQCELRRTTLAPGRSHWARPALGTALAQLCVLSRLILRCSMAELPRTVQRRAYSLQVSQAARQCPYYHSITLAAIAALAILGDGSANPRERHLDSYSFVLLVCNACWFHQGAGFIRCLTAQLHHCHPVVRHRHCPAQAVTALGCSLAALPGARMCGCPCGVRAA